MQPIDRDTQIKLMTDTQARLGERVRGYLEVPEVALAAKRCAFDGTQLAVSVKQVRVARRA